MAESDAELVSQALAGSQAAYRALVARYAPAGVNVAARMIHDRALAEELVQDAFMKAFARLTTYDTERKFSSWFLQIVHNVTIDHLRRRHVDVVSLDQLTAKGHEATATNATSPAAATEQNQLAEALQHALARIRPEYREAIVLRYQEGCTQPEIAEILGVPSGTVKTYLHRGRKELASHLSTLGWGPGPIAPAETEPTETP